MVGSISQREPNIIYAFKRISPQIMALWFTQRYQNVDARTRSIPHFSQRKPSFVSQENFKFHLVMAMSLAEEVLLCVGYAIIFITNIAGNLLVCAIVFKTKKP